MANPQVEDGFTKIANDIMDALCKIRIPGEERQVLDCILRKTYGWGKKTDAISLSQFVEMTGMNKPHIITAIKGLLLKKVIIVTEKGNEIAKTYGINKDYDEWQPLPKKVTLPKTVKRITEKGNLALPKTVPTKETITKETITKENTLVIEADKSASCPHQDIINLYHKTLPELPRVQIWTPKRQSHLRSRWKEDRARQSLEWWEKYFLKVRGSPFLTGNVTDFKANLEWLINQSNMVKVLEGKYDGEHTRGKALQAGGNYKTVRERELDAEIEAINREYYSEKAKEKTANSS